MVPGTRTEDTELTEKDGQPGPSASAAAVPLIRHRAICPPAVFPVSSVVKAAPGPWPDARRHPGRHR